MKGLRIEDETRNRETVGREAERGRTCISMLESGRRYRLGWVNIVIVEVAGNWGRIENQAGIVPAPLRVVHFPTTIRTHPLLVSNKARREIHLIMY